jgi:hypothetical protein
MSTPSGKGHRVGGTIFAWSGGIVESGELIRNIRTFGVVKTVEDLTLRAINRAAILKILKGIKIEKVDPEFLRCDNKYQGQFLDQAMLTEFAKDPRNDLTAAFLHEAFEKGDQCYGFLDGDALASYGWYSKQPTEIHPPGLVLHFSDQYVYMYKAFTGVSHRGQRLHPAGMTRALATYLTQGYKGLISYVEWNNFGSLRSSYRIGYADFGNIVVARVFGRFVLRSDAGCEPYGFRLEWVTKPSSDDARGGLAAGLASSAQNRGDAQ